MSSTCTCTQHLYSKIEKNKFKNNGHPNPKPGVVLEANDLRAWRGTLFNTPLQTQLLVCSFTPFLLVLDAFLFISLVFQLIQVKNKNWWNVMIWVLIFISYCFCCDPCLLCSEIDSVAKKVCSWCCNLCIGVKMSCLQFGWSRNCYHLYCDCYI